MGKIISNQRKNKILLTYGVFSPEQLFLFMYIYASPIILQLLVKKQTEHSWKGPPKALRSFWAKP